MTMCPRRPASGFTLIELMITIVVLGIIVGLGIPSLQDYILSTRVKTGSQELFTSLLYARSEALKRNGNVYIYPNGGAATDWVNGWVVTTQNGKTYAQCQADQANCLRFQQPLNGLAVTTAATSVTYQNDGRVAAGATFEVCDAAGSAEVRKRSISVTLTGRPTLEYDGNCS
ncbi:MAG: GspH/FimT family pseudopilin [Halofilum sp. (in: g-proteobacteria)]|nr:GspH/FimT family pseudopilin [Halofilum sp. (in: g-proteobacteria)]